MAVLLPRGDGSIGGWDDEPGAAAVRAAADRAEVKLEPGSGVVLYPPARGGWEGRVWLLGLGVREGLDAQRVRRAGATLARLTAKAEVDRVRIVFGEGVVQTIGAEAVGAALAEGLTAGGFEFDRYRGAAGKREGEEGDQNQAIHRSASQLLSVGVVGETEGMRAGFERAAAVARGVGTCRELAATPPNVCDPAWLVEQCRELAGRVELKFDVIDVKRARELGMGGLLAVGGAGSSGPAVIVLEWPGDVLRDKPREEGPLLLVGKAVTFDTGGLTLKPRESMSGMKYDKCGGCAVIGAMHALALLRPASRVVGVIPVAENLVDRESYRLDDILTFCNGVTCEVTNTDAEGRLILADALAWATRTYQPRAVVDLATLTGGVVVALGESAAGLFCGDDPLRAALERAAEATGERVWPLPLWDEHRAMMKGTHADLKNSGDRKASPIQGAAFLSYFVGEDAPRRLPTLPWAHLDIAGMAEREGDDPLYGKGPTGWGVRLVTAWVMGEEH